MELYQKEVIASLMIGEGGGGVREEPQFPVSFLVVCAQNEGEEEEEEEDQPVKQSNPWTSQ